MLHKIIPERIVPQHFTFNSPEYNYYSWLVRMVTFLLNPITLWFIIYPLFGINEFTPSFSNSECIKEEVSLPWYLQLYEEAMFFFGDDNSVTQCVPQTISFLKILSYALFPYPTAWIDGHINILQLILFNATGIPYVYLLTSITEVNKFVFTGFVRQFLLLVLGFLSARKFIENAKDFFKTSLHSVLTRRQQESLDNTERFWTSYLQGFIEEVLNLRPIRTGVLKVVRTITTNSKLNQLLLCYKRDFKNKLSEIANRIAWERDNTSDLTLSEYPLNIYDSPTTLKSEKCIMCLENGPCFQFTPCYHCCICEDCAQNMNKKGQIQSATVIEEGDVNFIPSQYLPHSLDKCPMCVREFNTLERYHYVSPYVKRQDPDQFRNNGYMRGLVETNKLLEYYQRNPKELEKLDKGKSKGEKLTAPVIRKWLRNTEAAISLKNSLEKLTTRQ